MTALYSWLAVALALLWAYPWARWLARREIVLTVLLTVTLSLGGLAWIMQGLAAIFPGLVAFWPITMLVALAGGAGWIVLRRFAPVAPQHALSDSDERHPLRLVTILIVLALVALTLFNAAYWPLGEDDALSLYAPMGYRIATTGQFGAEGGPNNAGLYNAYPQLNPLVMAYVQLAGGAPNEYAGRFVMAVLGLGTVGVAYALGRELFGRRTGLAAAYLVAATPILLHWAAGAYTDLPSATYYGLALVFAWRLVQRPSARDALLAGLLAGFAAFTKNSGLLIAPALVGWVVYSYWAGRVVRDPAREVTPIKLPLAGALAAGFLLTAGPWYIHSQLAYGHMIPPTGWTTQAQHTLAALIGPALATGQYMISGVLVVLGIGWQMVRLWRSRWAFDPRAALLVGFTVPYWGVWWWLFSYELRFLLLVWPVLAVMGANVLLTGWAALSRRWTPSRTALRVVLPLLVVALALPAMRMSVDHKPAILREPLMNDLDRHLEQLGDRWLAVVWLQNNAPEGASVLVSDYKLYFGLQRVQLAPDLNDHFEREFVAQHDYWLASPWQQPDWLADAGLREVYATDGYRVYAVP